MEGKSQASQILSGNRLLCSLIQRNALKSKMKNIRYLNAKSVNYPKIVSLGRTPTPL